MRSYRDRGTPGSRSRVGASSGRDANDATVLGVIARCVGRTKEFFDAHRAWYTERRRSASTLGVHGTVGFVRIGVRSRSRTIGTMMRLAKPTARDPGRGVCPGSVTRNEWWILFLVSIRRVEFPSRRIARDDASRQFSTDAEIIASSPISSFTAHSVTDVSTSFFSSRDRSSVKTAARADMKQFAEKVSKASVSLGVAGAVLAQVRFRCRPTPTRRPVARSRVSFRTTCRFLFFRCLLDF